MGAGLVIHDNASQEQGHEDSAAVGKDDGFQGPIHSSLARNDSEYPYPVQFAEQEDNYQQVSLNLLRLNVLKFSFAINIQLTQP